MKLRPLPRHRAISLLLATIFLWGCASPSPHFYTLSPTLDQVITRGAGTGQKTVIGLGPVKNGRIPGSI